MERFIVSILVSLGIILVIFELSLQLRDHLEKNPKIKSRKKPKIKMVVRVRRIKHIISSMSIILGFIFFIVKEMLKNIFFYYKKIINDWAYKKIESFENWLL